MCKRYAQCSFFLDGDQPVLFLHSGVQQLSCKDPFGSCAICQWGGVDRPAPASTLGSDSELLFMRALYICAYVSPQHMQHA